MYLHKNYFMNTNSWRGTIESFCGRTYVSWEDGWVVATFAKVGRPILDKMMLAYINNSYFVLSFLIYSFRNECDERDKLDSYTFM